MWCAQVEGRQDREQVAADVAGNMVLAQRFLRQRHQKIGQPVQKPARAHRRQPRHAWEGDGLLDGFGGPGARDFGAGRCWRGAAATDASAAIRGGCGAGNSRRPSRMTWVVYSPAIGSVLARQLRGDAGLAQHRVQVLLDVVGLAFLQQQHGALVAAEVDDLVLDDGVGHVHDAGCGCCRSGRPGPAAAARMTPAQAALRDQEMSDWSPSKCSLSLCSLI